MGTILSASIGNYVNGESTSSPSTQNEVKPSGRLSPWFTDILLGAPLGIRSDYFCWEGFVSF